jgi:hypothetical protein
MRGAEAGKKRPTGTGTILDALKGLHPALLTSTGTCPAMPKPLSERFKETKLEVEKKRKAEKQQPTARRGSPGSAPVLTRRRAKVRS